MEIKWIILLLLGGFWFCTIALNLPKRMNALTFLPFFKSIFFLMFLNFRNLLSMVNFVGFQEPKNDQMVINILSCKFQKNKPKILILLIEFITLPVTHILIITYLLYNKTWKLMCENGESVFRNAKNWFDYNKNGIVQKICIQFFSKRKLVLCSSKYFQSSSKVNYWINDNKMW